MSKKAETQNRRTEHRRSQERRQKTIYSVIIAAGAIILFVSGWSLWSGRTGGSTNKESVDIEYSAEDVAYDAPLHAVHEMGEGPPIPFLAKDGPQPQIEVSESFFDFGKVGATEVVTHEFVVANTGEAPLTISRAYTTCGCTTADFTSSIIPPGKVATISLRFDAGFHDTRGQTIRRGIIIENNDPNQSNAEIWVQASVQSTP